MYSKLFFAITLVLSLFSCRKETCDGGEEAVIFELAGCGPILEFENGDQLEPINLQDYNFANWMIVRVIFTEQDQESLCLLGPAVRIDCIAKRN